MSLTFRHSTSECVQENFWFNVRVLTLLCTCVLCICRWLEVGVANLTCMQYWVTYLRVLQQAVWPGGNLPTHPRPQRSQQQRDDTKQQSLKCLMNLLPGRVPFPAPTYSLNKSQLISSKMDLLISTNCH